MKTYSQVYQDVFVLKLIGTSGYFLDIGAGWTGPINSNTLLLEESGWDGINVDGDYEHAHQRQLSAIRSKVICAMIPQTTIKSILDSNNAPKVIDYVSIDTDPSSMIALNNFPFGEYEFKVMTFEHDLYNGNDIQKILSYELLSSKGYVRLCNNVNIPEELGVGLYFEDWWVNSKYFSKEFIENNSFENDLGRNIVNKIQL